MTPWDTTRPDGAQVLARVVSRGPVGGDPLGMSVSGPIARTVADAAALPGALAVPVPGESYPLFQRTAGYLDAVALPPARLRIGRYATPPVPGVVVDPACLAAYEATSTLLAGPGHEVVEFEPGIDPEFPAGVRAAVDGARQGHPVPPQAEPLLAPLTRWWRDKGSAVSGPEYMAATQAAIGVTRRMVAAQSTVDVVLTPMLAQPALSLPVGCERDGESPELPVSVHLVDGPGTTRCCSPPARRSTSRWDGRATMIDVRPPGDRFSP